MPTQYAVSQRAYVTLALHALRHPSCAVNGVLLGPPPPPPPTEPGSPRAGPPVALQQAVPLFHSQLQLAPLLELALTQARAHGDARPPRAALATPRHARVLHPPAPAPATRR